MADRLRYVGTWLSLVEHSLGVRGVGSSNLPVPTISVLPTPFVQQFSSWPTHEAPQPRRSASEGAESRLRGVRGAASPFGSSNLPVPTISVLPTPFVQQFSSWPTHEAPQPAPQRQRRRRIKTARGARRSLAIRQFESARPDHFSFANTLRPTILFVADPRSTPTSAVAPAKAPNQDCEGCEAQSRHSAVRICPSRPFQFCQHPSSSNSLRGRPTKHPNHAVAPAKAPNQDCEGREARSPKDQADREFSRPKKPIGNEPSEQPAQRFQVG